MAQEGKPCAKTGRNTQTNSTSNHKGGNPVELLKVSDLGIHRTRSEGTDSTALSSKSPCFTLVTNMPLKNVKSLAFWSVEFRKTAPSSFLKIR